MKIMKAMGIKVKSPVIRSRQLANASLGAIDGKTNAAPAIINIIMLASMKPGMNPARYNRPTDSFISTP